MDDWELDLDNLSDRYVGNMEEHTMELHASTIFWLQWSPNDQHCNNVSTEETMRRKRADVHPSRSSGRFSVWLVSEDAGRIINWTDSFLLQWFLHSRWHIMCYGNVFFDSLIQYYNHRIWHRGRRFNWVSCSLSCFESPKYVYKDSLC